MTHDFFNDKTAGGSNAGTGHAVNKARHMANTMPGARQSDGNYLFDGGNIGQRPVAPETDVRQVNNAQIFKPEMAEARSQGLLNIGEAAAASGVSAKSIRHYETIGLIPQANRTFANYRLYRDEDVQTLRFIRSARALGFSIPRIGELLSLWQDRQRSSADVKKLALQHVDELETNIRELQRMRDTLSSLAENCEGDERPDCPILQSLASHRE